MRTFFNLLAIAALIALAITVVCLTRQVQQQQTDGQQHQAQIAMHQATIDSLNAAFAESQTRVDTLYIELTRWRTRYDTIYQEIPLLPPTEQLALFDQYTGPVAETQCIASLLTTDTTAIIPMPRIERALVLFTERNQYAGEVVILTEIVNEQGKQIGTLHAIIEQKDGHIQVRNAWIETIRQENVRLKRNLVLHKAGIGILLLLLGVAVAN